MFYILCLMYGIIKGIITTTTPPPAEHQNVGCMLQECIVLKQKGSYGLLFLGVSRMARFAIVWLLTQYVCANCFGATPIVVSLL